MPQNRYWRPLGNNPLPTPAEALNEMFSAFPSWFLRIECERCGKVVMLNESHAATPLRGRPLGEILDLFRHDGCGGQPVGQAFSSSRIAASRSRIRNGLSKTRRRLTRCATE
jgi:hypothetical protein